MDFYKLIKSLDELVFELLSWLFYYPRTLWRMLVAPVETMRSAERELRDDEEHRFDELLGPPLFLALTLGLIHFVVIKVMPGNVTAGLDGPMREFMDDDRNLLGFRIIMFGILPLLAAARLLRQRDQSLDRNRLRAPFYAQCYAVGVFAIILNGAVFINQAGFAQHSMVFAALVLVGMFWLAWVEARWFHLKLGSTVAKAVWNTTVMLVQWILILVLISAILFS